MRALILGAAMAVGLCLGLGLAAGVRAQPPIEALPMILQLQPSQMAAWRAYRDAEAIDHADESHQEAQAQALNSMATPARLDAMEMELHESEAALQRHAAATKVFYSILSPDQRRTFDRITELPGPRRGGGLSAPPPPPPPPYGGLRRPANADALPAPGL